MKIEKLSQVITFRVSGKMLREIDQVAKTEDRKRADTVRRIFLKGWAEVKEGKS